MLQRGGNIFQYNIEDDEVIDLDCPITIQNLPANQKRLLRLSFDCSLLTVSNGDSAHIINLLKCSTAIKINQNHESSKVYGLRADYILLLNQNSNELCFQLKDQDQYYEYIFPGMDIYQFSSKFYVFFQVKNMEKWSMYKYPQDSLNQFVLMKFHWSSMLWKLINLFWHALIYEHPPKF